MKSTTGTRYVQLRYLQSLRYSHLQKLNQETLQDITLRFRKHQPKIKWKLDGKKEAGVLLPLCTVAGKPSILFTVRSSNLREHKGEVSFPGGMRDEHDVNIIQTALRETMEEIFVEPRNVQVLGPFVSLPNRSMSTKVTAIVGYLGAIDPLAMKYNHSEVSQIFTVDLETLLKPTDIEVFRDSGMRIPSWKVHDGHRIWGLTGYILNEFISAIK
jgi:nudix motif 8